MKVHFTVKFGARWARSRQECGKIWGKATFHDDWARLARFRNKSKGVESVRCVFLTIETFDCCLQFCVKIFYGGKEARCEAVTLGVCTEV